MRSPWYEGITGSPQQYVLAFVQTLTVTLSVTAAGGAFVLPGQLERLRIGPHVAVLDCQNSADLMVMLIRETPDELSEKSTTKLVTHELSTEVTLELEFNAMRQPTCFAFSPGGQFFFVGDADGAIHFIDRSDTPVRSELLGRHLRGNPTKLSWSNDQRTLVSLGKPGVYVWDLKDRDLRWCRIKEHAVCGVILPHSPRIVCYTTDGEHRLLREFDLHSGQVLQVIAEDIDRLAELNVAPDGCRLVGFRRDGVLLNWDRQGHSAPWQSCSSVRLPVGKYCVDPAFSPASDLLAAGHPERGQVVIWDLRHGRMLREIGTATDMIVGCRFLDQHLLVTWDADGHLLEWNLNDPSHPRRITLAPDRRARR